jgi:hypothetical protein
MKKKFFALAFVAFSFVFAPFAQAIQSSVSNGEISDISYNEVLTEFGMVTGAIKFKLGNLHWTPQEIWLMPSEIDPDVFKSGLTQLDTIEVPENATFSTCRTAVYLNSSIGYGFKIYNTGSTTQILQNGTFCGLAYNGTYFVYARY